MSKIAPQGLGIWIAYRDRIGSAAEAARRCVELGASWVAPRAGDGGLNDRASAFGTDPGGEITAYKAAGLRVYPWLYARAATWRNEVEAWRRLIAAGADGIFIDAEQAFANARAEAVAYGNALRAAVGHGVFIADCPWPWIGAHPEYPNAEFAAFCDARAPQVYWTEINGAGMEVDAEKYEAQWKAWEVAHPTLVRPRLPIGVMYGHHEGVEKRFGPPPGDVTTSDIGRFLDRYGSGASLYTLEAAADAVLELLRMRAAARRPTDPAPAPEVAPGAESVVAPLTLAAQLSEVP